MTASAELTARGADDVSDRLVRVEQLRERARGLAAVIVERRRALERDRGRLLDAGVVASLESDAARYAEELAIVRADLATLHPEIVALEADEERFGAERQGVLELFDPPPAASASSAVAEVRGELRSRRAAAERAEAELIRGRHRIDRARRAHRRAPWPARRAAARLPRLRARRDAARRRDGPGRTAPCARRSRARGVHHGAPASRRGGVGAHRPGRSAATGARRGPGPRRGRAPRRRPTACSARCSI